jgi:hypothetical protein
MMVFNSVAIQLLHTILAEQAEWEQMLYWDRSRMCQWISQTTEYNIVQCR